MSKTETGGGGVRQTPGPLIYDIHGTYITARRRHGNERGRFVAETRMSEMPHHASEDVKNFRLLTAAYTSYDKHCGARAVECAEADLLGEALGALRKLLVLTKMPDDGWNEWFERMASEFETDTGMLHPLKDQPAAMCDTPTRKEREVASKEWADAVRMNARAVLAKASKGGGEQ